MNNEDKNKTYSFDSANVPSDLLSFNGQSKKNEQIDNNKVNDNNVNDNKELNTLPKPTIVVQENENKPDMDLLMKNVKSEKVEKEIKTRKQNKWFFVLCIGFGICFAIVLVFIIVSKPSSINLSGSKVYYEDKVVEKKNEYDTYVVADNFYDKASINNQDDAIKLIIKDSTNQKSKCSNEKTKEIETLIEKNYGITAINLCELDYEFAKSIEKTLGIIYKEFPMIKGYLTNITLTNVDSDSNYIASFVSAKLFAKSNSFNSYPNVYKMSIMLNSAYFLNTKYLDMSIEDCLSYGYFPNNANKYSMIAHEMGHYLSFVAQVINTSDFKNMLLVTKKNYSTYSKVITDSNEGVFSKKIIDEAFENYKKKYSEFNTIYAFRNSISEYAVVTDSYGSYIYDETIAEAFHDYYLNGSNAKDASKEIVNVLKKYLNKN